MFFVPSSPRWRTVDAEVLSAEAVAPMGGMVQAGSRLTFGPKKSLSVAGQRYLLRVRYCIDRKEYNQEFTMVCEEVPKRLTLAYDPLEPSHWDWPEDRTLESGEA